MLELNDSNFDNNVMKSDIPVLVDFWAAWCMPCVKMGPIFKELAEEYDTKIKFAKVNVEKSQALAQRFGIRSIPTLLIFKDGKIVSQIIGVHPKRNLEKKIKEFI
ncbi:MAG: thioredoxin [Candidatus Marinimicrobia bacterium]|nr:thioredoxin [Candidatus Neomarinimicrobiota bacterium]